METNQPIINTVTNVPKGYVFPNGMSRAHQLGIVWDCQPDYDKDGKPIEGPQGCLLETPLIAVADRIGILMHPNYRQGISSPEKLEEALEYIERALECMKKAWQPQPQEEENGQQQRKGKAVSRK